jgi:hypothetical protein
MFIKVIATSFLIRETPSEHMIDSNQDRMCNRKEGFLGSATRFDAVIEGGQVGVFAMGSGVSGLDEQLA